MTRKRKSPADRLPGAEMAATESSGSREAIGPTERLAEIERQLKTVRPRPPRLDVRALEELVDTTVPAQLAPSPGTPQKSDPHRRATRRRPYRRVAALAASWTCGAIVGALVMFLAMSRLDSGRSRHDSGDEYHVAGASTGSGAHGGGEALPSNGAVPTLRDEQNDASNLRGAATLDETGRAIAMLLEELDSGRSVCRPAGQPLRAGTHLRLQECAWGWFGSAETRPVDCEARHIPGGPDGTVETADDGTGSELSDGILETNSGTGHMSLSPFVPPPPVTSQRLLEDLRREMTGLVL
ncbi:MAG: hypothetical protein ACOY3P_08355 [Planctomycetota bacterium]